ncbi:target of Myb protein 1 isoform X1 [Takifugu flavidus]|uniref:target of Myb protein 1 isoform X1 n=1 Tax=Takifugu flavidus TaxID=433684 RepID=UPI0025440FBB|nr:target of Myb protein 1 isoform X1 [Takifugu flavidus]
MEFLLGNPFGTPVGQRIESATSSSLVSEDWTLNMEICDLINSSEEGPKDAVRAIKKRIVGNKNFKEVMLTLTVLETCVKNCGYKFHILVTARDFVETVLVRSIIPRNSPPLVVHDRVLSIIQAWADAFRSSPEMTGVVSVYEDLRRKGLEFPITELNGYPSQPTQKTLAARTSVPAVLLSSKPSLIAPQTSDLKLALDGTSALTPIQVKMLKTELGVVRSNLTMMSDMMSQLDPVTVKQADMELLQQLYTVCKEMQERIVKIVPRLSEEKLIEELLTTNDEMNTAFTRFHRFEKRITKNPDRAKKNHASTFDTPRLESADHENFKYKSITDHLSSKMAKLATSESSSFDSTQRPSEQSEVAVASLALSGDSRLLNPRGVDVSPASTCSSSPKLDWMMKKGMIPISHSSVMDDLEIWLALEDEYDFEDSDGVTTEEFDRFLAERAKAAEHLPSLNSSSQDNEHIKS